jgi:hypothetical protein
MAGLADPWQVRMVRVRVLHCQLLQLYFCIRIYNTYAPFILPD